MQTKNIKLSEMIPDRPEFELSNYSGVIKLRVPNMMDHAWLQDRYPDSETFKKVLDPNKPNWKEIARIVYQLMDMDSKRFFAAQDVEDIGEDGPITVRRSGPDMVLLSIQTTVEAVKMMGALTRAIALSNPIIEEEVKKKMAEAMQLIGAKSSTPSRTSTGGRKGKSRS
jgi:hypothetical protein